MGQNYWVPKGHQGRGSEKIVCKKSSPPFFRKKSSSLFFMPEKVFVHFFEMYFFISNSIFELSLELLTKCRKFLKSLKIAMKLLCIFAINAESCLNFDHFKYKFTENKQIWQNFRFQAQKLLRISDWSLESCY